MTSKLARLNKITESLTWIVIIAVIFGIRFLPKQPIGDTQTYILIGIITAFALLYYLIIYKYFSRTSRMYLKGMADIILIGVLIHLLKDYGQFFFALYFLPLAAVALSLEFINALLIATIACMFVILEIFLGSYDLLPQASPLFQGVWQIGLILFITIFCRYLALQLKEEQTLKEESIAKQHALEEESRKEKEFIAMAAHQIYTPLSIIRGFASMFSDETLGKLVPKQKKAAKEIYDNTKRLTSLVSELLSISRIQSGILKLNISKVDIKKMLTELHEEFRETTENKKVQIKLELPDNLEEIEADNGKIRQVCTNLIDNALKYTKSGEIDISVKQNVQETIISISDTGIGVKPEDNEKIFEPFFRGKNILELDNQGTGLGLYISKLIILQHNGRIWFESINNGTKFSFSIPNKQG
jgi:signal transduction histidine kinase